MTTAKDNLIAGRPLIRLGNVVTPTVTLYKAKGAGSAPGPAIVVFPGGGYNILAIDLEGTEVCDWLTGAGVNCVLLKYRVPGTGPYPKSSAALQDAQRAMGLVRLHAAEWGIDPNRVGVLGFSAGGHLSAAISNIYDKRLYDPIDEADKLSCRRIFPLWCIPGIWQTLIRILRRTLRFILRLIRRRHSLCKPKTIRCTWRMRWSTTCS